jgi:hypothetical protein
MPFDGHVRHVDPGAAAVQTVLRHKVSYIAGAGHDKQVLFAAFLELLLIIANIGTAVVIFPILRRQNEELSLGYVTARLMECTFILVGILSMVTIVTLRNHAVGPAEATVAYTLAEIKDWTFLLGPGWVVGWGNGLILGYLMYKSELVPRQWCWIGLIGGPADHHHRHGHLVHRQQPEPRAALSPKHRDHPGGCVGTLPRHLLHLEGIQTVISNPSRRHSRGWRVDDSRRSTRLEARRVGEATTHTPPPQDAPLVRVPSRQQRAGTGEGITLACASVPE